MAQRPDYSGFMYADLLALKRRLIESACPRDRLPTGSESNRLRHLLAAVNAELQRRPEGAA